PTAGATAEPSGNPGAPGAASLTHAQAGLMKLDGLAALPAGHGVQAHAGYPGKGYHYGVFRNPDELAAFVRVADVAALPEVDWIREVVAYVVLDAQTNALEAPRLTTSGDRATLTVTVDGIEPFYADRTPVALAVVRLGVVEKLSFRIDGGPELGTVAVSSE
ncbi:MAG: hypothetical protein K8M05_27705, partial [Deltaproteobacteria bacterium]|nr:hypothetical protein [Kofleriaceae bacterium]